MTITLEQIKKISFRIVPRGYKRQEVENFIQEIIEDFQVVIGKNSPNEIQNKNFSKGLLGYDPVDVRKFLMEVSKQMQINQRNSFDDNLRKHMEQMTFTYSPTVDETVLAKERYKEQVFLPLDRKIGNFSYIEAPFESIIVISEENKHNPLVYYLRYITSSKITNRPNFQDFLNGLQGDTAERTSQGEWIFERILPIGWMMFQSMNEVHFKNNQEKIDYILERETYYPQILL